MRIDPTTKASRCTKCMVGQGRHCPCRSESNRPRYSAWSPVVNVLLILLIAGTVVMLRKFCP